MENAKKPEQKSTLKLLKEQRVTIQQLLVSHLDIGQRSYYDFETTQELQEILKANNQIFKNLGYEN